MVELLRCRQCKELLYSDDTVSHGCRLGFDPVDQDLDEPDQEPDIEQSGDVGTFMKDMHYSNYNQFVTDSMNQLFNHFN